MNKELELLLRRFELPEDLFKNYALFRYRDGLWVATPEAAQFQGLGVLRRGLRLARVFPHTIKPTTNGMQLFGRYATRNRVELDWDGAQRFIRGEEVLLDADLPPGFVIVFFRGFPLGVGFYKAGRLKSQVPRSRRIVAPKGLISE